jgi:hypothetical protein
VLDVTKLLALKVALDGGLALWLGLGSHGVYSVKGQAGLLS